MTEAGEGSECPALRWAGIGAGFRMDILTKENLVGAKFAPTAASRTFTPLLRETRFP